MESTWKAWSYLGMETTWKATANSPIKTVGKEQGEHERLRYGVGGGECLSLSLPLC